MKLTNFAFLPPLDDIKKELLNRLKNDFPEIEFLVFEDDREAIQALSILGDEHRTVLMPFIPTAENRIA